MLRRLFICNLVGGVASAIGTLVITGAAAYISNPMNRIKIKKGFNGIKGKLKVKKIRVVM